MVKFSHPEHLWLLALIPVLFVLWIAWWHWRKQMLQRLGDTENMVQKVPKLRFWLKNSLYLFAISCLALAWADPLRGAKMQSTRQEAADVFIALDISQSMLCQDISPSRLELAKIFSQKLIKRLEGERIGLIFFAGNAFLQMPLSTDYTFLLQSIQSASPDMLSEQGTNIGAAIDIAEKSFDPEPGGGRMLIVVSDGETHDEGALERAEEAFDNGTVIYTVGAGTTSGGPIPVDGGGGSQFKRDENNAIVKTQLDEAALGKLALSGGGQFFNMSMGDAAVGALTAAADGLQKRSLDIRSFASFESGYQWFLLPALLLFFGEFFVSMYRKQSD